MQFTVSGTNRETGARMALQFEASSKAAAEKKAANSGMDVHHCVPLRDANDEALHVAAKKERGRSPSIDAAARTDFRAPPRRSVLATFLRFIAFAILLLIAFYLVAAIFVPRLRSFHLHG